MSDLITTASSAGERSRLSRAVRSILFSEYLVLGMTILYVAVIWPFVPEILNPSNLQDIFLQVLPLFIAAIGVMFVLMVAQIDLSATSIMAMASVVGASIMTTQGGYLAGSAFGPFVAIVAFLAVGAAIGALNGVCTAYFGMPSFLVTLTTMMFFSGSAIWYTAAHTDSGSSIGSLPSAFVALGYGDVFGQGSLLGIPYALIATLIIAVGAHVVQSQSVFGKWLFAVGLNPRAAEISGVPVKRVIVWTFVISGVLSAIAAIIYTGRLEAGTPILGQRILLDIIGAAVIGGVSLFGGTGKVMGVFFGVLFLSVVDNGLQLLGLSLSSVYAIKGGVILFAAVTDAIRHRVIARG